MDEDQIKRIVEAALLAAGRPLSLGDLERLFSGDAEAPPRDAIRRALAHLGEECEARPVALQEVASGYRLQVRQDYEPWVARLWDEKPPRYSRALLETLAIIAYRQPITRSEIEEIRGVSVSTQIMRTLGEREWVRVVGHREAPGKPAMYGTTRQFLDHFNLKTLDQLPPLSEIHDMDSRYPELGLEAEPASTSANGQDSGEAAGEAAQEAEEAQGEAAAEAPETVHDRAGEAAEAGSGVDASEHESEPAEPGADSTGDHPGEQEEQGEVPQELRDADADADDEGEADDTAAEAVARQPPHGA